MGSSAVRLQAEVGSLVVPISAEHPSGESLRYEGAYDRILEARREDDSSLSQGVWKSAVKRADWSEVEKLCRTELETRTKDLQIAAWLLEAWIHLREFAGVREGLELIREFLDKFWDDLHPQIIDGDLEFRIAPITWINEKLSVQLKLLPITAPESDDARGYTWSDWENACRAEALDQKQRVAGKEVQPARVTLPDFQKSAMLTPTGFLAATAGELEQAMEACTAVEAILDRRCGKGGPSLRQFWGTLEGMHGLVLSMVTHREPPVDEPVVSAPQEAPEEPAPFEQADVWIGQGSSIRSRDEAYQRLAEAAEYLARTEPHSPTSYLVKRAIAWGGLSLPDLLPELVRNQSELSEIFRLLNLGENKARQG